MAENTTTTTTSTFGSSSGRSNNNNNNDDDIYYPSMILSHDMVQRINKRKAEDDLYDEQQSNKVITFLL